MFKKGKMSFTKRWFIYVVLQFVGVYGFSQVTVSGTITDTQNNTLQGATVVIKNSYLGTSANANGLYSFKNLKKGKYNFVVSFLGYKTVEKQIELLENKELNFTLSVLPLMTDEVIVAATRAGNKTPVATSNLKKENIEKGNTGQDIPYQLSLMPSVVASSESGSGVGYSSMRIRGTDATRINVTINGVPLNDSESQGVFWVNMPDFASSVDNVQIQRGVGTSTNGSAAFGATINFKTESVNTKPYAEVQSVAGSFNTFRNTFKAGTGLINKKLSFDARYSDLRSDGFVDRAFSKHKSLFLSGNYYTEKSLLKFNLIHGNQKTGISWWGNPNIKEKGRKYNPAGEYTSENGDVNFYKNQTDNYIQTHYQLFFSHYLKKHLYINTALHYTKGSGHYEQYKEDEKYSEYNLKNAIYGNDTVTKTDLIRQKKMKNDFYGFTASLNYRKKSINAVLGGAWNFYDGDHFGTVIWTKNGGIKNDYQWYLNTGKKTDYNIFAKINFEIDTKINAFADVQYRHIDYDMTGTDDDLQDLVQNHKFNFFNPKVGIFYTINNKNNAYASFAVANREPTRANFKDAKGDPNSYPVAETLYDYELGYNYSSAKATVGVNFYYMNYKNQLVPTGEKSSVGYDIMTNVKNSYRAGIELIAGVQLLSKLKWDVNLTLSRNRIKNFVSYAMYYDADWNEEYKATKMGDTHISYSPELIGSSSIVFTPISNFNIAFMSKYVGEQYFDNTSSSKRKLDGYFVNNLRLNYTINPSLVKEILLHVQINNIFGVEYENNAYGGHYYKENVQKTWAYYFPQAGINFLAGISFKF